MSGVTGTSFATVTARVAFGTKQLLVGMRPLFKAERARARSATQRWDWDGLPGREAEAKRAQWAMYRAHLREDGELFDTVDVLVAFGVRAGLVARGWDREWPVLPVQARNPGRWPGTRDGGWPERLPAALVNHVLSACWHTSEDAIGKLRDWRDEHPDMLPTKPFRYAADDAALAEYEALAAQVTPAGHMWRAAVQRGLAAGPVVRERQAVPA